MKTGDIARVVQPEIKGIVMERRINKQTDEVEVLLGWLESGEAVHRWFEEKSLESVKAEQPAEGEAQ